MNESFVPQLEDRLRYHRQRITSLEEQRAQIDEQIREVEAVLPHYEALIIAERALEGGAEKAPASHRAS